MLSICFCSWIKPCGEWGGPLPQNPSEPNTLWKSLSFWPFVLYHSANQPLRCLVTKTHLFLSSSIPLPHEVNSTSSSPSTHSLRTVHLYGNTFEHLLTPAPFLFFVFFLPLLFLSFLSNCVLAFDFNKSIPTPPSSPLPFNVKCPPSSFFPFFPFSFSPSLFSLNSLAIESSFFFLFSLFPRPGLKNSFALSLFRRNTDRRNNEKHNRNHFKRIF